MHWHTTIGQNRLNQLSFSTTSSPSTATKSSTSFADFLSALQNLPSSAGSPAKNSPATGASGFIALATAATLTSTAAAMPPTPSPTEIAALANSAPTIVAAANSQSSASGPTTQAAASEGGSTPLTNVNTEARQQITDSEGDPAILTARAATIQSQLALYNETDKNYNDLCKSIALAGAAPAGYISTNVAPGILQGPGVTDQVGGITIPRADLYYAHDLGAQIRQTLRDGGTPTLPSDLAANQDVKAKFDSYVAAFKSMPTFAGPLGTNLSGFPTRTMSMLDANALQAEATKITDQLQSTTTP